MDFFAGVPMSATTFDEHYQSIHGDIQFLSVADVSPTEDQFHNTSELTMHHEAPSLLLPNQTQSVEGVYQGSQCSSRHGLNDSVQAPIQHFQGANDQVQPNGENECSSLALSHPAAGKQRRDDEATTFDVLLSPMKSNAQDARNHQDAPMFYTTNSIQSLESPVQPAPRYPGSSLFAIGSWSTKTSSYPTPTTSPKLLSAARKPKERLKEARELLSAKPAAETLRPTKRARQAPDDDKKFLACPFYKRDPKKYHECLKYELRRCKDVKQHIYRKHTKPEFYCARCFKTFDAAEDRDCHTRELQCDCADNPHFDGISDKQRKLLKDYVSQKRSVEEQWFDTWNIIYPDQLRPKSCYYGNYAEETMSELRAFWDRRHFEIIQSALGKNKVNRADYSLLIKIMGLTLDRFETEMSSSVADTAQTSPLATPPTSAQHMQAAILQYKQSRRNSQLESVQNLQDAKTLFGDDACRSVFDNEEDLPSDWLLDVDSESRRLIHLERTKRIC